MYCISRVNFLKQRAPRGSNPEGSRRQVVFTVKDSKPEYN